MLERQRVAHGVHEVVIQLLFAATLALDTPTGSRLDCALATISDAVDELGKLVIIPAA